MTRWLTSIVVFCAIFITLHAKAQTPERIVTANVITSKSDPRLRIVLPRQATYLGADRWLLYDVADCEVHIFVEADEHKVVQRMYWVQFEAYLPGRPELKHTYSDPVRGVQGMDFFVRARFGPTNEPPKSGSDSEHVQQIIQARGYTCPLA